MKRALFAGMLVASIAGLAPVDGRAQVSREPADVKYLRVPHRFQVFMEGGIGLPSAPGVFNDYWNSAFVFGIGFGMSVQPWLEVNGYFNSASFSLNAIEAKGRVKYTGVEEIQGGSVSTKAFSGSVKFLAVPKARTNPYIEIGLGAFSTSASDVIIEGVLRNNMEGVSGITVWPAVGLQYAMSERWSAYSRFTYMINLNSDFAPGDLLLPPGGGEPTIGDDQVISSINVGVMMKF